MLAGAGIAGIENTGDAVLNAEDMGARSQSAIGITDLGHQEPVVVLLHHLKRHRPVVHRDRDDLGYLTEVGVVDIGDIPEPEDAVPPAGELGRDGFVRLHQTIAIDGVLSPQTGDHHRVVYRAVVGDGAEHHRPEQTQADE